MPDTHNSNAPQPQAVGAVAPASRPGATDRLPAGPLLHYAALLSGFGTAFLGPSLPALTAALHQSDRGAGALIAAQFIGAFLGGWATRAPLFRCLLRGYVAAAAGFSGLAAALAFHRPPIFVWAALFLLGFGIGQIITSNNLLASRRWSQRRGAALTLLNFTWSAGALCAPLLLPTLHARYGPASVFALFAALLVAGLLCTLLFASPGAETATEPLSDPAATAAAPHGLRRSTYLYFCLQLFLYGGVETSLSGWLTIYDVRYAGTTSSLAASTAAFWFCLTGTRAAASALLLRLPERPMLRAGLGLSVLTLATLLAVGHGYALPVLAGLTGVALAPWFPLLFSGLVSEGPTPAQAGRIVAVSGLGAAALPWLVGQASAATGSLRQALLLPIAGTVVLFLLSFRRPPAAAQA